VLNDGETTKKPVIGQVPERGNSVGENEHRGTFVQATASAECAPAPRRPLLASENVELMRKLIVGQVSMRRNGDNRNEHQETFIHTVAGAKVAPACCRSSQTSRKVEETYLLTKQVSKRWAAHATLPPVVQTNYVPIFQVQTSSKTCRRSSQGYLPTLANLVISKFY
jgi:hypothetical protein